MARNRLSSGLSLLVRSVSPGGAMGRVVAGLVCGGASVEVGRMVVDPSAKVTSV